MTENLKKYRDYVVNREHTVLRTDKKPDPSLFTSGSYPERMKNRFKALLDLQDVVFIENEMFIPTRTAYDEAEILTENDPEIKNGAPMHECGWLSNICPNYARAISLGLVAVKEEIKKAVEKTDDAEKKAYGAVMTEMLDAIIEFSDRYKTVAKEKGLNEIAEVLERVPRYPAESYREALQFFRILHFCLWLEGDYHVTVGRFDQYMYPYLKKDMDKGVLDYDTALEMTESFFVTFNKETDIYRGIQQGDNGQSMMLGGLDLDGNDTYNLLSELCLKASMEVQTIDPKINLRVSKNTPMERLIFASELTAKGTGFPQYSNDDVVLPGLIALGYDKEDAVNYTVAACWEFIIPGVGMDIPNKDKLSFPDCVNTVIKRDLEKCSDFSEFLIYVDQEIKDRCKKFPEQNPTPFFRPAPLMSVLMDGCTERLTDITLGSKYNNYGIHGFAVATAADSIAAINALVFNGFTEPRELIDALEKNFEGYEALKNKLLTKAPKMGNDDDGADSYAVMLLNSFAEGLAGLKNDKGGIIRAGTGSANLYAIGRETGATADGRLADDYMPANYSPSVIVKVDGPFSIISSFTKPDLKKTINGGPLTLELASNAVKDREGIEKTAFMVKKFIDMGGHQMQLNVVNNEKLRDAQKNPDKYRNLVVRVWGWSGYFTELDKMYQDQILSRTEHTF